MKIIVEGIDGAGKTTLIDKLSDYFHCDVLHAAHHGSKKYEDYLAKYTRLDNMIFDRCFMSEYIYSKVFKRECELPQEDYDALMTVVKTQNIPVIILDCDTETLRSRLLAKNEFSEIVDQIDYIRELYFDLAKKYNFIIVNTLNEDFEQTIKRVKGVD